MKTTLWEIILLVLYFPVTLFYLFCGYLAENPHITTVSQWFEARVMGLIGPILGLLTFPCLIAAIYLRKKGKTKVAAWLRFAPLLILISMFLLVYLLRWITG